MLGPPPEFNRPDAVSGPFTHTRASISWLSFQHRDQQLSRCLLDVQGQAGQLRHSVSWTEPPLVVTFPAPVRDSHCWNTQTAEVLCLKDQVNTRFLTLKRESAVAATLKHACLHTYMRTYIHIHPIGSVSVENVN